MAATVSGRGVLDSRVPVLFKRVSRELWNVAQTRLHKCLQGGKGTLVESNRLTGSAPPPTPPHNVAGLRSLRCRNVGAGNVAGRGASDAP